MMFISFSLKRTTVIVSLGDRWLKFCFEVNYDVWKGGETVLLCWVCEFMLFQTARPWFPPLELLLCPASDACAEERRPSDFPLGSRWAREPQGRPRSETTMIDLAHTVLNKRVSVLINVVLTLKKKKKMVPKHCEHVGIQNLTDLT